MQCRTTQQINAGDHTILIGEVLDIKKFDKDPLLYFSREVGMLPAKWPN